MCIVCFQKLFYEKIASCGGKELVVGVVGNMNRFFG